MTAILERSVAATQRGASGLQELVLGRTSGVCNSLIAAAKAAIPMVEIRDLVEEDEHLLMDPSQSHLTHNQRYSWVDSDSELSDIDEEVVVVEEEEEEQVGDDNDSSDFDIDNLNSDDIEDLINPLPNFGYRD